MLENIKLQSENVNEVLKEISVQRKDIKPLQKKAKNTYHNNEYSDIKEILNALNNTMSYLHINTQEFVLDTARGLENVIMTTITHKPTGQFIRSISTLGHDGNKSQAIGSAITYMRRYHLQSMFNMEADPVTDDDGNSSNGLNNDKDKTNSKETNSKENKLFKETTFSFHKLDNDGLIIKKYSDFNSWHKDITTEMKTHVNFKNNNPNSTIDNILTKLKVYQSHIELIKQWANSFNPVNEKHKLNIIKKCDLILTDINKLGE
jgi:hypothetical protein